MNIFQKCKNDIQMNLFYTLTIGWYFSSAAGIYHII